MPNPMPQNKLTHCKNGHYLNFSMDSNGYYGGDFICDNWKQSKPWNQGRLNCLMDKYDIW